ncbi:isochorismatase family protein [Shewanella corallii]|uniref:Isochorismatase family protein n=1 Tax=Shewanella corallii TaxID=560080 RepID=A0ABT0N2N7_9GAMM|nr:isochorismatase family protein [Shewanella corallii]MCL2912425.1 isochorismatase family protein [Shewanella corallii]
MLSSAKDVAFLFIDHQSGLIQTVKDISAAELRANAAGLAKAATLLGAPSVYTESVPEGPNGPIIPEIKANAPDAVYARRTGEINAWDSKAFVDAVKATGKKTLIMSGIWTSVCVALPALSAIDEGYTVYAVIDASGDNSTFSREITMARLAAAGVTVVSVTGMLAELQKTWNRDDAEEWGAIYANVVPNYAAAIEQHTVA